MEKRIQIIPNSKQGYKRNIPNSSHPPSIQHFILFSILTKTEKKCCGKKKKSLRVEMRM